MTTQTPEKFVVGEFVTFYHGEDRFPVEVTAVNGDEVTAEVSYGREVVFTPRADGKHVALGQHEYAVMPDVIAHPKPVAPVKVTLWDRIAEFFA